MSTFPNAPAPHSALFDGAPAVGVEILRRFFSEVCAEAELIMAQTNTVSGAHYNAMKRVLKRYGVEVE